VIIKLLAPAGICWALASLTTQAQMRTPNLNQPNSAQESPQEVEAPQEVEKPPENKGLVSAKPKKDMANSHIEEITNENFPELIDSFDYPNADINDLVRAISELTGKNFVIDPNVHGKISVIAPSRITVAEAYKAFLSALAINGLAVVPGDGFYKIKQARAAQRDRIETYGGAYYPTSDQMITRIVKLKYISADEINKQLRIITSNQGEVMAYAPTNSLIISDYGSNIDRVMKILAQLDVQGFEEKMEVVHIKYARAKDMAELIEQIIGKGDKKGSGTFPGGAPMFRRPGSESGTGSTGAEVFNVVVADERTNSLIVVGNKAGIEKIRRLVNRLDFRLHLDEQGGVFVYYVRNHEAEQIAATLNNIASEAKKALDQSSQRGPAAMPQTANGQVGPPSTAIFGGDVKIAADKLTNSLIVTAGAQDYEVIKRIIAKLDVPRDQVYIKAYIMEMNVSKTNSWSIDYYKFAGSGAARTGFRGSTNFADLIDPSNDKGGVIGFGGGGNVTINNLSSGSTTPGTPSAGTSYAVQSIDGLVKLIAATTESNVISTPQLMAINNEEAMIEVGEKVPVANNQQTNGNTITSNVERQNVTTKLTITPHLSPDDDRVKMKVKQEVAGVSQRKVEASELAKNAISTTTRNISTQLVVDNGDTAVLGGLMSDTENVEETKIPLLGDIPILGWLFKSRTSGTVKTNLMVFITPKIVRNPRDSEDILNSKIDERIEFIQRNMEGRDAHGMYVDEIPRREGPDDPHIETDESDEALDAM
jgi:general secretion pathway protein D